MVVFFENFAVAYVLIYYQFLLRGLNLLDAGDLHFSAAPVCELLSNKFTCASVIVSDMI